MTDNSSSTGHTDGETLSAIRARFEEVAADANRRCGQSYEYYLRLFSAAADPLLAVVDPEVRDKALRIAAEFGYGDSDEEPDYGPGICTLTGTDDYCCPCGRHP